MLKSIILHPEMSPDIHKLLPPHPLIFTRQHRNLPPKINPASQPTRLTPTFSSLFFAVSDFYWDSCTRRPSCSPFLFVAGIFGWKLHSSPYSGKSKFLHISHDISWLVYLCCNEQCTCSCPSIEWVTPSSLTRFLIILFPCKPRSFPFLDYIFHDIDAQCVIHCLRLVLIRAWLRYVVLSPLLPNPT